MAQYRPIPAVLCRTLRRHVRLCVPVDAEDDVKAWDEMRKATRETPSPRHDPITEVTDVATHAPPAADNELCASLRPATS